VSHSKSLPSDLDGPRGYDWGFVALSYHSLILNRTFLVLVSDRVVAGAVVRGVMGSPELAGPELLNPLSYPKPKLLQRYAGLDIHSDAFLAVHAAGFRIDRTALTDVILDLSPKWGMGKVPYSGRIILRTRETAARELILLGRQDVGEIRDRLWPPSDRI
jgi:hypothetical protein